MPKFKERTVDRDFEEFFARRFSADSLKESGLWCKECRKRSPWSKIKVRYEMQSGDVHRVWFCPRCDAMLADDCMEELPAMAPEQGPFRADQSSSPERTKD